MATIPQARRPRTTFPVRPPPGKYDPSLDASVRASDRGYRDLQQDTSRNQGRLLSDYGIQTGQVDYRTNTALADAFLSGNRLMEDYGHSTADLNRGYQNQATQQNAAANAAGLLDGGYLAQALGARQVNQQREQGLLDQSRNRGIADLHTSADRAVYAGDQSKGALSLALSRGNEDLATALSRGGREHTAYGLDSNAQRLWQARYYSGWVPPKPKRGR